MGSTLAPGLAGCELPLRLRSKQAAQGQHARNLTGSRPRHFIRMVKKVLCVCVGNISRSPMMQALLQQHLGAAFLVESAGVTPPITVPSRV